LRGREKVDQGLEKSKEEEARESLGFEKNRSQSEA